jgi:hypothetical protein
MIEVRQIGQSKPLAFDVVISDHDGETHHRVTMSEAYFQRLAEGKCSPERCIDAAFRFLLDREPKEAILSRFDLSVVPRYFPEFEAKLAGYIDGVPGQ